MKKILAVILAAVTVFALAACGGGSTTTTAAQGGSDAGGQTQAAAAEVTAGEAYDTGVFTVTVPSGWKAFEATDMFGEQDADGNYPVDPNTLYITKGGESEYDTLSKPTITVAYQEGFDAESQAESGKFWYDETSDIDVTVNGTKCYAFEAKSESLLDEGKYYVYDVVFYPVTAEDTIQFIIPVDMVDYAGVNITDADVVAIMESTKLD